MQPDKAVITLSEEQQGGQCPWSGVSMCEVPDGKHSSNLEEKAQSFTVPGLRDGFLEEVAFKLLIAE